MRQALAGLLWSKQYYEYDVHRWLREHGVNPWDPNAPNVRNVPWFHMVAGDVMSMPDTWEYPWFAAWDLAFHCAPLSLVDVDFAKEQVELLLKAGYMHPNGQIPAYEWNFSDVNPPVTAWAALWVYQREQEIRGKGDRAFLTRVFLRLLTNFTWWVNRKDPDGRNLFQGGFLGLDNIGIFDRSAPLPGGGTLQQADGTAWMALYCQWMLQIAIELGREDPTYNDIALKFIRHFAWIAIALNPPGADTPLWDEQDGFFYDVMRMPDGTAIPLKVRSLVGLLPLCAATVFEADASPELVERALAFAEQFGDVVPGLAHVPGANRTGRRMLALVTTSQLRQILTVMLDEDEFLGPHGIRAISRRHLDEPYEFDWGGQHYEVALSAGGVRQRAVRRQLELARPGLVPDEPRDHAGAVPPAPLLRRRLQGRVPDRLRPDAEPAPGVDRDRPAAVGHVPARRGRAAAGVRRDREVPDRPALARPDPVPRVLPRRQRRRARRQPPDRVDRDGRAAARARRGDDLRDQHGGVARPGARLDEVSWDAIPDVDAVWLMGVWQRSPVGREISRRDVPGAARRGRHRLAVLRARLRRRRALRRAGRRSRTRAPSSRARGVKLILDYVPNHVAPDHPWVAEQPGLLHPRAGRDASPTAATRTSRRGPT